MHIAAKTQKGKPRPKYISPFWGPALTNTPLSHAHTASPRPLARAHDTNTKRNRNRLSDWGSPASITSPQSLIQNPSKTIHFCYLNRCCTSPHTSAPPLLPCRHPGPLQIICFAKFKLLGAQTRCVFLCLAPDGSDGQACHVPGASWPSKSHQKGSPLSSWFDNRSPPGAY